MVEFVFLLTVTSHVITSRDVHDSHVKRDRLGLAAGGGMICARRRGNNAGSAAKALAEATALSWSFLHLALVHPCTESRIGRICTHDGEVSCVLGDECGGCSFLRRGHCMVGTFLPTTSSSK